jgi:hypothetical protein
MSQQANGQLSAHPLDIGKVPKSGAHAVSVAYNFTTQASFNTDLTSLAQQGKLTNVQTVYVDNTSNNEPVIVLSIVTNQSISVPAGVQGYYTMLVSSAMQFTVSSTGNGTTVQVQYIDVIIPPSQWDGLIPQSVVLNPQPVTDTILDATVSGGRVTVLTTPAQNTDVAAVTQTITLGGTAQLLFAANAARKGWMIQNVDETNLEELGVSTTTITPVIGAAGTFTIGSSPGAGYAGGSFQGVGSNAVYIIGATTGHKFTAIQW